MLVRRATVKRMESRGVLFEMLKEVSCIHFVKKCGAILEFIDVDFFDHDACEFLAAIFGCLPNTIVSSASLVDGFGFFQCFHRCVFGFGDLVVPQAKALWDRK